MSSEFIESARQLLGLKFSGFITEEIYITQIALMAADVIWDSGRLLHPGAWAGGTVSGAAARDTPVTIQVQKGKGGETRMTKCDPKVPARHLQLLGVRHRAAGEWFCYPQRLTEKTKQPIPLHVIVLVLYCFRALHALNIPASYHICTTNRYTSPCLGVRTSTTSYVHNDSLQFIMLGVHVQHYSVLLCVELFLLCVQ